MKCEKCNGAMIQEEVSDFYCHIAYMKCMICGNSLEMARREYQIREEVRNAK
jgi:hypothetical protein